LNDDSRMLDRFAQTLRAARGFAGMSQNELAEAVGVSRDTIANYENGRRIKRVPARDFVSRAVEATSYPDLWAAAGYVAPSSNGTDIEARMTEIFERTRRDLIALWREYADK